MSPPDPILLGLKRRFGRRSHASEERGYRAFTTAYDEIVEAADLAALHPIFSYDEKASFHEAVRRFDALFAAERVEIAASGAALVRDLRQAFAAEDLRRTVVSFLIDHSGSMRGLRMMSALIAVEGAVDALWEAEVATEMLGFTTVGWHGGNSRRAWRWAGRPADPGRLCDLRHIVYGSADRTARLPWHLRLALRPDLLHENVDGEALLWAAGRLDPGKWARRIICLVSDGAPVDDSTLLANGDRTILVRHLAEVEERLAAEGITVAALLLGGERFRDPALAERAEEPLAAGLALLGLIRRALPLPHHPLS